MDKPITLIVEETKMKLAEVINTCGLPPFIIEPMLSEFLKETQFAVRKQYELDKAEYDKFLQNENNEAQKATKK